MTRRVIATVQSPTGEPREGLRVDLIAPAPHLNVTAITDAAGDLRLDLEPGVLYTIGSNNAFRINDVTYPAGTVFRVSVPEGEGPVALDAVTVAAIQAGPAALLARIEALEARVTALEVV